MKTYPVTITIMEVEWLENNLADFYMYLNHIEDDTIFANEFIKVLLEQQSYSSQIILKIFTPYIAYNICCLAYFTFYTPYQESSRNGFFGGPDEKTQTFLRCMILIGAAVSGVVEVKQLYNSGWMYFVDIWNYTFWFSNILAVLICIQHSTNYFDSIDQARLVELSSLAVFA